MRKQYLIQECSSFRYVVILYIDGVKVDTVKKWQGDELSEFLEYIESLGYTRGFTQAAIDAKILELKHLQENLIKEKQV